MEQCNNDKVIEVTMDLLSNALIATFRCKEVKGCETKLSERALRRRVKGVEQVRAIFFVRAVSGLLNINPNPTVRRDLDASTPISQKSDRRP